MKRNFGAGGSAELWGDEDLRATALKWRDQPAASELPAVPSLYEDSKVTLCSHLLGCAITVEVDNVSSCIELAESALAALESLLSTGTVYWMGAREPVLTAAVRKSELSENPFEFQLEDQTGRPHLNISCCDFDPHSMSTELQEKLKDKLVGLLAAITGRIVLAYDLAATLDKLIREELAFDRSVAFTGSFVVAANVLGSQPRNRISRWSVEGARDYPLKRPEPWDAREARLVASSKPGVVSGEVKLGKGEPPRDLLDQGATKHTQIRTVSLIREVLWDKAGWSGTGFAIPGDLVAAPILVLIFRDPEAAKKIFAHWQEELGRQDRNEQLRITIVRGSAAKILAGTEY